MEAAPSGAASAVQLGQEEQALLDLINTYREQNGLSALNISPTLTDAAAWMSGDMAEKDYFSHTDSLGRDPFQRMADFGYSYNTWKGENLAAGSDTAQMTFDLWRASPGHNDNLLNANFLVVGLARAYGSNSTYGWYWTADFGGYDDSGSPPPTPPPPTPSPTNTAGPPPTTTPPPTQTPEPSPTATPPPPPPPSQTPEPSPTSTPPPTATPPQEPTSPPISEPAPTQQAPPPPEPTLATDLPWDAHTDFGLAPPTREEEPSTVASGPPFTVRELAAGWNLVEGPARSLSLAEVLPVDSDNLLAIYIWEADRGGWRRHLPGVDIEGLNTLTELPAGQRVWILAVHRLSLTLPT